MSSIPTFAYKFGEFTLDADQRVLIRGGQREPIPPKAFDILLALVQRKGDIVDKETVMKEVWPDTFVEDANLGYNVHILRRVLGNGNESKSLYIETVPKRGYRFVPPVVEVPLEEESEPPVTSARDAGNGVDSDPPSRVVEKKLAKTRRLAVLLRPTRIAAGVLAVLNVLLIYELYSKTSDKAQTVADSSPVAARFEGVADVPAVPQIETAGAVNLAAPAINLEREARAVLSLLVRRQYPELVNRFDSALRVTLTTSELEHEWIRISESLGRFRKVVRTRSSRAEGLDVVDLWCEFEEGERVLRVVFNPSHEVDGLWLLPAANSKETERLAREVVDMLVKQDYPGVANRLDSTIKASLTPEQIQQVWQSALGETGSFRKIVDTQVQENSVVDLKTECEDGYIYVRVAFDARKQIRALWVRPAQN